MICSNALDSTIRRMPYLSDALEQVIKDRGLPVRRVPQQRFGLPLTAWREGME